MDLLDFLSRLIKVPCGVFFFFFFVFFLLFCLFFSLFCDFHLFLSFWVLFVEFSTLFLSSLSFFFFFFFFHSNFFRIFWSILIDHDRFPVFNIVCLSNFSLDLIRP